ALGHFPRGFVESMTMVTARFAEVAEELFAGYPIRQLHLHQAGDGAARLAARPELAWVEVMYFADYYRAPLGARGVAALAASPYLGAVESVDLSRNPLGADGVVIVESAPWRTRLRSSPLRGAGW